MKQQLEKYKERVSDLSEESNRLIRALHVLTLENLKLREKLDSKPSKVSHLRWLIIYCPIRAYIFCTAIDNGDLAKVGAIADLV
jgi:hypothetical protein